MQLDTLLKEDMKSSWSCRVTVLISALVLSAGMMFLFSAPASAHNGSHYWPTDGCTQVPELRFNHPCVHHDGCYTYHWADRSTCDQWFRNDMHAICRSLGFNLVTSCAAQAETYYWGVRSFGDPYYRSANVAYRHTVRVG
jgi:hypothetical protein